VLRDEVIFLYKLAQQDKMPTSGGSSSTMRSAIASGISDQSLGTGSGYGRGGLQGAWQIELFFGP